MNATPKKNVKLARLPRTQALHGGIGRTPHSRRADAVPSPPNTCEAAPAPWTGSQASTTAPSHLAAHEVAQPARYSKRTEQVPSPGPFPTLLQPHHRSGPEEDGGLAGSKTTARSRGRQRAVLGQAASAAQVAVTATQKATAFSTKVPRRTGDSALPDLIPQPPEAAHARPRARTGPRAFLDHGRFGPHLPGPSTPHLTTNRHHALRFWPHNAVPF